MRCAIYARYSSDNQSDASIADQLRVCSARAEREGWAVGEVFTDHAISGSTANRPGYQALLAALRERRFDLVLAESLDRLSRDQEHVAHLHKLTRFAGVRIVTLAEGEVSELHVGLKGTMAALFLRDLAQKTHRGLEGVVESGRSAGGLCFGYQVRRGLRPDGEPITGELDIDDAQAAVIRRVFEAYALGRSPRAIARELNAEGIKGPRGGQWTASALIGHPERLTGLLRNPLYRGLRIWNRQSFAKDPLTGKRIARLNDRSQWRQREAPELAIVSPSIWEAVERRLENNRLTRREREPSETRSSHSSTSRMNRLASTRRGQWPLAGLVRCGCCKGPMTVMGAGGRLGCANHVERGSCDNKRTILRDKLLDRVLVGLKTRLLRPDFVEAFATAYVAEINAGNRERGQDKARLESQLAKLRRQMRNMLELIKDGMGGTAVGRELLDAERQEAELERQIASAGQPEAMPVLHPNLPQRYRRLVERLEDELKDPTVSSAAGEVVRHLVSAILIHPGERRGELSVELHGDLAAFLEVSEAADRVAHRVARNAKAPVIACDNRGFGEVLALLDAGTGFGLWRTCLHRHRDLPRLTRTGSRPRSC